MAEFVIKLADERGRVQEQVQTAATADELRTRFVHAGYHVFSVKARGTVSLLGRRKVKLEKFLIFNQQFLTLVRAGLPILGSLNMLAKGQKDAHFAAQLEDVANRVKTGEALSSAFEAQAGDSDDLYDDAAGGRAVGQSAGGAGAVCGLPARGADVSQEAGGVADLSHVCC